MTTPAEGLQDPDAPRATEEETRAFLERHGITADHADTFDLARVLLADDADD